MKKILHSFSKKETWLSMAAILSFVFLIVFLIYVTVHALYFGVHVNTVPIDGTFQLYNPLRRIAEGQITGVDFPFFHGIGVPLLHYPVFVWLGQNVFAAETAKWLVSPLLFVISSFIFFLACFREKRKTLIATALFTILAALFINIIYPDNSLRGVRTTLPILVAAAVIWNTEKSLALWKYKIAYKDIVAILLLGFSVICGTEQGAAAIIAFILLKLFIAYQSNGPKLRKFVYPAICLLCVCMATFILFTIITMGHPFAAIHYAFVDIPSDQGWYFGAPPNRYLTWGNLLPTLFTVSLIPFYLMLVTLLFGTIIAATKKLLPRQLLHTTLFVLLYGVIVFLAGALEGYYSPTIQLLPLFRVVGLILIALIVYFSFSRSLWQQTHHRPAKIRRYSKTLIPYAVAILLSAIIVVKVKSYALAISSYNMHDLSSRVAKAPSSDDYFAASPQWKKRLDTFRPYLKNVKAPIWSTYTSLYDSYFSHSTNPSSGGEDYMIHAVGEQRRKTYIADFINSHPEYAITINPTYTHYEEWLIDSNWGFYKQLLTHYDIVSKNDTHLLWKLRSQPRQKIARPLPINPSNKTYALPMNRTNQAKLYEVTVNYSAKSNLLSPIDKIPRYFMQINHTTAQRYPISLPPYTTTYSFPVVVAAGQSNISLAGKVDGIIPTASLEIKGLTFQEVPLSINNSQLFPKS